MGMRESEQICKNTLPSNQIRPFFFILQIMATDEMTKNVEKLDEIEVCLSSARDELEVCSHV